LRKVANKETIRQTDKNQRNNEEKIFSLADVKSLTKKLTKYKIPCNVPAVSYCIFSEHVRYMLSPIRLSCVCCLSSVTFVRPTQPVEVFGNVSMPFGTLAISFHRKFYGDRPRRTPPSGGLNARGVAKYTDFGPIEGRVYLGNGARQEVS